MKELGIYEQLVQLPYLTAYKKVLEAAITLDLFSALTAGKTAAQLAAAKGWDTINTKHLLEAIFSLGFLDRDGETFRNTAETSRYLVKGSPDYMGSVLLFFGQNQGMDPGDVVKQVREGGQIPEQRQGMEQAIDFAAYGDMMREAQSGIRIREVLELIRSLPENNDIRACLDLGCGAGMIGLALAKDGENRVVTLFDTPPMASLVDASIAQSGIADRAKGVYGDFLKDGIGSGYDLILCSSIMFFALPDLANFIKKLHAAVNGGGVVVCINEGIAADASGPWEMILGYLPMKMMGMPVGVPEGVVKQAAEAVGFQVENRTALLSTGTHDINILRKPR